MMNETPDDDRFPISFSLALCITFSNAKHYRSPFSPSPLNPYNLMVLTFMSTMFRVLGHNPQSVLNAEVEAGAKLTSGCERVSLGPGDEIFVLHTPDLASALWAGTRVQRSRPIHSPPLCAGTRLQLSRTMWDSCVRGDEAAAVSHHAPRVASSPCTHPARVGRDRCSLVPVNGPDTSTGFHHVAPAVPRPSLHCSSSSPATSSSPLV
ncbi:hypothetical protein EXIGLDRAFT_781947 [Exidia glandulosa HHB12029]|uniref:Uncharacterized protein n=1 Tax=Exidia glandulosa HHB12029 TaxID=1314781 RepID=A0A165B2Q2_EXIGL|nr:hypothetical protein EXIGLDRAFT_781947 [Exidia glandulosa HHB12029]